MTANRFPIEAGHIMMFARALGDPNPVYHGGPDMVSDRSTVIAPPTFAEASIHYDADFPYRPRIGEPWFGSAREPSSGDAPRSTTGPTGVDGTRFHGETHFEYFDALCPGDVLEVTDRAGAQWEKQGTRGGHLWFSSRIAEFSKDGHPAVRLTTVAVTTEQKIPTGEHRRTGDSIPVVEARSTVPVSYPVPRIRAGDLTVRTAREMLLVDNLTRAQILLYAGASGDFSPQHTDEVWNTKVGGYPSVFAHGMLTMGMTGRLFTDWFGDSRLRRYGLRFARQVWPGDTLTARAAIEKIERVNDDSAFVHMSVVTLNGQRDVVASGYATVEVPA